jgi:methylmalonyl-CoA/ethylmalonyl-CoA epimerase
MAVERPIFQICLVVPDAHQASAHWARVLDRPEAPVETLFPAGIVHHTHGKRVDYTDLQVAKYDLGHLVLELMQPGPSSSPWRDHLDQHGPGVFHVCLQVDDRRVFQQTLGEIGVGVPYHVGYWPGGSYSYVDSKAALGLELSVNHRADHTLLMQALLSGAAQPLDDMR